MMPAAGDGFEGNSRYEGNLSDFFPVWTMRIHVMIPKNGIQNPAKTSVPISSPMIALAEMV